MDNLALGDRELFVSLLYSVTSWWHLLFLISAKDDANALRYESETNKVRIVKEAHQRFHRTSIGLLGQAGKYVS